MICSKCNYYDIGLGKLTAKHLEGICNKCTTVFLRRRFEFGIGIIVEPHSPAIVEPDIWRIFTVRGYFYDSGDACRVVKNPEGIDNAAQSRRDEMLSNALGKARAKYQNV